MRKLTLVCAVVAGAVAGSSVQPVALAIRATNAVLFMSVLRPKTAYAVVRLWIEAEPRLTIAAQYRTPGESVIDAAAVLYVFDVPLVSMSAV